MKVKNIRIISVIVCLILLLSGCDIKTGNRAYSILNGNVPSFEESEITTESFETYSELDKYGRCGVALACIGKDIMPTEERESIGQVKPSGWRISKYDFVDGKYLYNRCHLIGFQLTGENANEKNLITGTRYMNVEGMLPFENMVSDYIERTGNHVMYRVTPDFIGKNLVANGVQMEALSVEDNGEGVSFNVYVFNIQPGVEIDYADGSNRLIDDENQIGENDETSPVAEPNDSGIVYVLNNNSKKFHIKNCDSVSKIKEENREEFSGTREWLIENGYTPCGSCKS